jgi:hypothetical protein
MRSVPPPRLGPERLSPTGVRSAPPGSVSASIPAVSARSRPGAATRSRPSAAGTACVTGGAGPSCSRPARLCSTSGRRWVGGSETEAPPVSNVGRRGAVTPRLRSLPGATADGRSAVADANGCGGRLPSGRTGGATPASVLPPTPAWGTAVLKNGSSSAIELRGRGGCPPRDNRSAGPTLPAAMPFWSSRSEVKEITPPVAIRTIQRSGPTPEARFGKTLNWWPQFVHLTVVPRSDTSASSKSYSVPHRSQRTSMFCPRSVKNLTRPGTTAARFRRHTPSVNRLSLIQPRQGQNFDARAPCLGHVAC